MAIFVDECYICGKDLDDDDYNEDYGCCWKCLAIARIREVTSESIVSEADVYAMYPDLDARLDALINESSIKRERVSTIGARASLYMYLPFITFDFDDLSFIDGETGKKVEIGALARERNNPYTRNLDAYVRFAIKNSVDRLINARKHREKMLTLVKKKASGYLIEAVAASIAMKEEFLDKGWDVKKLVAKIAGTYLHKGLAFVITNDPVALVGKSTGQCWEELSCEKIVTGVHGYGPYSDIMNLNPVVLVLNGKKEVIARLMLRWGVTDKNTLDFGIEMKWYFCGQDPLDPKTDIRYGLSDYNTATTKFWGTSMTLADGTLFVIHILKNAGLYDYKYCETPYIYDGFSDTLLKSHTTIEYRKIVF